MAETTDTDLLICGSCKRSFQLANILGFMKHKKFDCEDPGSLIDPNNKVLLCQACRQKFNTPWSLLKHAQNVHFLRIYLEQNYHVSNVSVEEEPKGIAFRADNGIFSSSLIDNSKSVTSEQSVFPSDSFNESADCASEQPVYTVPLKTATEKVIKAESESLSQGFASCPDTCSSTNSKEDSTVKSDGLCCDDQDCGINVMPGTHESLKRCCSAVVPKKRKRHMEIKHRMNFLSRMRRQRNRSNSPASIIIDVTTPEGEQADGKDCHPATDSGGETLFNRTTANPSQHQLNKTNSVIIQPGSTFSIPLSFARTVEFESEHQSSCSLTTGELKLPPSLQVVSLSEGHLPDENTPSSQSLPDATLAEIGNNSSALEQNTNSSKAATPNILQGILAQMFSEKAEIVSGLTSGGVETTVQHEVISLKQEPNASNQCSSLSKSQSSMGRNLNGKKRRYPTSRPYKCDQCNDAFNQRIHLKKHQSKHTGIKPFKCDLCDYATVERSHLKVHIRVHTGEKPFKCTYCEYATAQRSTLKIHLKRHHSTTDHCLHCSRRDHTQCYPNVVPPGTDNNNLVQPAAIISPGGPASIQTPGKMSPLAGGSDVN